MANRGYFNGLVTGGLLGAVLGAFFILRQEPKNGLRVSQQVGNNARRVLRGISRGVLEMMRS